MDVIRGFNLIFNLILLSTILKTKTTKQTGNNNTIIVCWRKFILLYPNVTIMWILAFWETWQKKPAMGKNKQPIFLGARFLEQVLWKSFHSFWSFLNYLTIRWPCFSNSGKPLAAGIYTWLVMSKGVMFIFFSHFSTCIHEKLQT